MLGDSAVLGTAGGGGGSSGDAAVAAAAAAARAHDGGDTAAGGGGGGSNSGDDERGDRSFGGNRWPRQETLALLKIRSDMDVAFRDASVKGPLWDEVSRKLADLGYHRNAKKCKEKFENVYKYHKRTKEGRSGKSDGKTYRFFDQLQALENNPSIQSPTAPKPPQQQTASLPAILSPTPSKLPKQTPPPATTHALSSLSLPTTTVPLPLPPTLVNTIPSTTSITVPSIAPSYPPSNPSFFPSTTNPPHTITPPSFPNIPTDLLSDYSTSSTSSDETMMEAGGTRKRKRKWKDFFERLMKEVMEKQEQLQKRFLEAIEKREQERTAREEAWKMQEMQKINREREILAQERSIAAAKDAAVMTFLQKISEQQNLTPTSNNNNNNAQQPQDPAPAPSPALVPVPVPVSVPAPVQTPILVAQQITAAPVPQAPQPLAPQEVPPQHQHHQVQQQVTNLEMIKGDNGESVGVMPASSSRWPKAEVEALIKLRTSLDTKYQDSGPKGPLWEEISALMRKMGYNRNAKRCKEKWENINKYFKKVKESNKKRPEDAKTCPYFHQLDALYREKSKMMESSLMKPESAAAATAMMAPLMVRPEQQWPPQPVPDVTMVDAGSDRRHSEEEDYDDDNDYDDKDIGDEDEDDEGTGKYEIVASKPAPR
ncbi:trihelix transcription factor DF1-like [Lotus japonicus]|uniref:trihelix transcription factor DF1-like n=1 Tax=Lotus japonicus TaxID=34305 RepID=UPI00258F3BAC|nr:trihelix transcription factor DF1-like [Lotus japonicus]